jgi:hypothetical protein
MHQLSPFTCRRLSQLPRLTSVWECDRRPLATAGHVLSDGAEASHGDCIIWVDSLQGVVRGLSVVPRETGHEAIVRTLLQAIETPQGGVEPARPRKVVVCDREIQFFLRGALQDLDIPVEHTPTLPVIDEVFQKLQTPDIPAAKLPEAFETALLEKAELLWQDAPWHYLSEQEILAIELNCWEIETLYLSVLGLAGMEYGLLFYRDLDSLKQFRHKLLRSEDFSDGMQQAFLEQNCLFINFNPLKDVIPMPLLNAKAESAAVEYEFGSLHPLEGLRSQLAAEEAASLVVVLEALHRFFKKHDIGAEDFALQPLTSRFRIPNPVKAEFKTAGSQANGSQANGSQANGSQANGSQATEPPANGTTQRKTKLTELKPSRSTHRAKNQLTNLPSRREALTQSNSPLGESELQSTIQALQAAPENITVKISTVPETSAAFLEETLNVVEPPDTALLTDDTVPEGALIMLGSYKDKDLAPLRNVPRIHYQRFLTPPEQLPSAKSEWPILTIQTSRPKAQQLVERLQREGGLAAICFSPGRDPINEQAFQVGLLQTERAHLHLFNEYEIDDPGDRRALEKWAQNSHNNHRCCGCIIATGATGSKRGRPTEKEVVAFFEVQAKLPEEIGLPPLVMSYAVEWEP